MLLQRFREQTADPTYLREVVREYFLDNTHRLTLQMSPDPEYNAQLASQEQLHLANALAGLTDNDLGVRGRFINIVVSPRACFHLLTYVPVGS